MHKNNQLFLFEEEINQTNKVHTKTHVYVINCQSLIFNIYFLKLNFPDEKNVFTLKYLH